MGKTVYVHKTSKEQYVQFKKESKHGGELLHKIYMNEVGKGIAYQTFISNLAQWLRLKFNKDTRSGVKNINDYLTKKFA